MKPEDPDSKKATAEPRPMRARLREFASLIRALLVIDPLIYLYTGVCGAASLAGSFFDSQGRWQHGCARVWSHLILATARIRLRVEGLENIPRHGTCIFCVNHPSAMDI